MGRKIEVVEVTRKNATEILFGEGLYGIRPSSFTGGKYVMREIGSCDINEIVSGKVTVIRITEEDA